MKRIKLGLRKILYIEILFWIAGKKLTIDTVYVKILFFSYLNMIGHEGRNIYIKAFNREKRILEDGRVIIVEV